MRIINKNVRNKYFCSLKNTDAFTLVEIIMVMAIISIVSIFSFGYFSDFASKQAAGEDLSNLNQIIRDFDYQIRKMNIYDYRMILETWSLASITYINYINQDYKRLLQFSNLTLTWNLTTTWITSIWTNFSLVWYASDKKYFDYMIDALDKKELNFANFEKIEINSTISGASVNDIFLNYYSTANSFTWINQPSKLILTRINTEEDKWWTSLSSVTIENINNKKFIKDISGQIVDKVFLFFERTWKEFSLEIK